jgi:hypothetical protein
VQDAVSRDEAVILETLLENSWVSWEDGLFLQLKDCIFRARATRVAAFLHGRQCLVSGRTRTAQKHAALNAELEARRPAAADADSLWRALCTNDPDDMSWALEMLTQQPHVSPAAKGYHPTDVDSVTINNTTAVDHVMRAAAFFGRTRVLERCLQFELAHADTDDGILNLGERCFKEGNLRCLYLLCQTMTPSMPQLADDILAAVFADSVFHDYGALFDDPRLSQSQSVQIAQACVGTLYLFMEKFEDHVLSLVRISIAWHDLSCDSPQLHRGTTTSIYDVDMRVHARHTG